MKPGLYQCKVCSAIWRLNRPDPNAPPGSPLQDETWTCRTPDVMGECCDNVAMGDQLVPVDVPS